MINSGREWDWMDNRSNIEENLRGWGFDVDDMKEEGALSSPPKVTRAFSTKVSNDPTIPTKEEDDKWCHYGGLPSPKAYM
jgi:hypothetical protein